MFMKKGPDKPFANTLTKIENSNLIKPVQLYECGPNYVVCMTSDGNLTVWGDCSDGKLGTFCHRMLKRKCIIKVQFTSQNL